jgi:drug/metabolite transporter (DMT)-like permease
MVLITYRKSFNVSVLKISVIAALLWATHFVLAKYVYLALPFWSALIWIRIAGAIVALTLLFSREVRESLFKQGLKIPKKTAFIFFLDQGTGAVSNILLNWAIALAPLVMISLINALQGVQYVFLFIIAVLISFKFPQILKEEISGGVIFKKLIAILLIAGGILLLSI